MLFTLSFKCFRNLLLCFSQKRLFLVSEQHSLRGDDGRAVNGPLVAVIVAHNDAARQTAALLDHVLHVADDFGWWGVSIG